MSFTGYFIPVKGGVKRFVEVVLINHSYCHKERGVRSCRVDDVQDITGVCQSPSRRGTDRTRGGMSRQVDDRSSETGKFQDS